MDSTHTLTESVSRSTTTKKTITVPPFTSVRVISASMKYKTKVPYTMIFKSGNQISKVWDGLLKTSTHVIVEDLHKDHCTDSPKNWYDSDGPMFNCKWYAQANRCAKYGSNYRNMGKTAKQACCACNGGSEGK